MSINETALVAYTPTIDLPALAPNKEETLDILRGNMEGLGSMKLPKVKMPSGGAAFFSMLNDEGKPKAHESLKGVIISRTPHKAWFAKDYGEKSKDDIGIPDCYSADCVTGSGYQDKATGIWIIPQGQRCDTCPKNQWGSHRKGGRAKDCSDKVRIHQLLEGTLFPIVIDLPSGSVNNFKDYIARLSNKLIPFAKVVTTIGLEQDTNAAGTEYSKATFGKAAELTQEEYQAIKTYMTFLEPFITKKITREDLAEDITDADRDGMTIDAEVVTNKGHQAF